MSRRSRRNSSGASQQDLITSNPVSAHPIDACSVSLRHLRQYVANRKQHRLILHDLDFVNAGDDLIQDLFYNENRHKSQSIDEDGSILMPPPGRRRSAQQILEFFEWGKRQKREVIQSYHNCIINTNGMINYTDSQYCEAPLSPIREEPNPTIDDPAIDNPVYDDPASPSITVCGGINIEYLQSMRYTTTRLEEIIFGFADTYRESLMTRLRLENARNPNGGWKYAPPVVGALTSGKTSGAHKDRVIWTCTSERAIPAW
jgi:hypothetical protein